MLIFNLDSAYIQDLYQNKEIDRSTLYRRFHKFMISSSNTLLKMYVSFIRPHLKYAAASWDPFMKKDTELIEDVQKFALRVCLESWSATYAELLEQSVPPSIRICQYFY